MTIQGPCGELDFTETRDRPWLGVTPSSGGATALATVSVNPANLARNPYHDNIVITAPVLFAGMAPALRRRLPGGDRDRRPDD